MEWGESSIKSHCLSKVVMDSAPRKLRTALQSLCVWNCIADSTVLVRKILRKILVEVNSNVVCDTFLFFFNSNNIFYSLILHYICCNLQYLNLCI